VDSCRHPVNYRGRRTEFFLSVAIGRSGHYRTGPAGSTGPGWEYQVLLFSGLSIISLTLFKRYQHAHPVTTDQPALNRRGEQYIGRTFTLEEPISNRTGVIRVDDSTWRITGADLPTGTTVTVVGVDGVILKVEAVQD
jgi:hypothetical protein